jgi:MYXO-CTERM domain-containing protein
MAYNFYSDAVTASAYQPLSALPMNWGQGHVAIQRLAPDRAAELVLNCAGAWPRDHVAKKAVEEARMRSGSLRLLELGNLMQELSATSAPADTDGDGMPDAWESMHGFDPARDDHLATAAEGYPALEAYLEERANGLTPCGQASMMMSADAGVADAGLTADAGGDASRADAAEQSIEAGAETEDSGDELADAGEPSLGASEGDGDDSASSDGGCACRTTSHGRSSGLDLGLGLGALGLWLTRRRRRSSSARNCRSS